MNFETKVSPESVGIPSESLIRFYEEMKINKLPLHNFILLRHGKVVSQASWYPYTKDMNHIVYSTSKTICALGVGFALQEGLFGMDDKLVDFFPELITGPVSEFNALRTVRFLLSMQGGETGDASSIDRSYPNWLKTYINTPPRVRPGTLYGYDNSATHALAAIIQKTSGMKLMDYMQSRLFDKIGVSRQAYWEEQMGINTASRGFHCNIEDLARIAQFVAQHGEWEGEQLLDRAWLDEATAKHVEVTHFTSRTDGNPGYGYKFWLYRDGAFGTKGNGGQNFIVYPKYDIVWAFTANMEDSFGRHSGFMHFAWPVLFEHVSDGPLPENPEALKRLREIEETMEVAIWEGMDHRSPLEKRIDGHTYVVAKNSAQIHDVTFNSTGKGIKLTYSIGADAHKWTIEGGFGEWLYQDLPEARDTGWARYVWRNDHVMEFIILQKETLGAYGMIFYVNEDNSVCVDIYPIGWRDMNRSIEVFGMAYCWDGTL